MRTDRGVQRTPPGSSRLAPYKRAAGAVPRKEAAGQAPAESGAAHTPRPSAATRLGDGAACCRHYCEHDTPRQGAAVASAWRHGVALAWQNLCTGDGRRGILGAQQGPCTWRQPSAAQRRRAQRPRPVAVRPASGPFIISITFRSFHRSLTLKARRGFCGQRVHVCARFRNLRTRKPSGG
jgi:hypothetical protein